MKDFALYTAAHQFAVIDLVKVQPPLSVEQHEDGLICCMFPCSMLFILGCAGADYVKHTMPLATSTAMLAWSLLTFREGFAQVSAPDVLYTLGAAMHLLTDWQCADALRHTLMPAAV